MLCARGYHLSESVDIKMKLSVEMQEKRSKVSDRQLIERSLLLQLHFSSAPFFVFSQRELYFF